MKINVPNYYIGLLLFFALSLSSCSNSNEKEVRERTLINNDWQFYKYTSMDEADDLVYDIRPEEILFNDNIDADSKPTEALEIEADRKVLKAWVLPTANEFINNPQSKYIRPEGNPGNDFPFVQADFDDSSWENIKLPHDWGIKGPFQEGWDSEVGGGMGRLPSHGVAWYRKKLNIPESDKGKSIFLDIDGAMSYAIVWLNGNLVGGWPYGYNSWRLDLSPYIVPGGENQLAIRIDNPPKSARWYPGGGIYRNVWLTKTDAVHVSHWGTYITTRNVSETSAAIDIEVSIDNDSEIQQEVELVTEIFELNQSGKIEEGSVASFETIKTYVLANDKTKVKGSVIIQDPKLWGPKPSQAPNMYLAQTIVKSNGKVVDEYETEFGIRTLEFDPEKGVSVNGELIKLKGANQHHDLGALGAAFNKRAAERQLEILAEMGCNAIRMAHNPPAPELLELTDKMGFLVIDEIHDVWERKKTPLDFHLIFPDWHEADTRSFIRRDRNHPSVIMWSIGNEVGEQYTGEEGAAIGRKLNEIAKDEDPTRPTATAMNYAKPWMDLPPVMDVLSLNYQGEGIRNAPAYKHLQGIRTSPLYPDFHEKFPDKLIISSENAAAVSSRGEFIFPVVKEMSGPVSDGNGADPTTLQVSAYELYTAPFGSSADKVFASLDKHPYVAGGFVWSGWDYLGEPTPYYLARSSYYGVIDLAGFKKERFYLYQSCWRPDFPMAHILPHWNWPERIGKVTPVHVFTSGDEAELFLNGISQGKKKKGEYEYRLRWDDILYEPGELKVVAYKNGEVWAKDEVITIGAPSILVAKADRTQISSDGKDLSFITVQVCDENGLLVPRANRLIEFSIEGPGEIVATDNGDPTCMTAFPSTKRKAFNGLVLAIVRGEAGNAGTIIIKAKSEGLKETQIEVQSR